MDDHDNMESYKNPYAYEKRITTQVKWSEVCFKPKSSFNMKASNKKYTVIQYSLIIIYYYISNCWYKTKNKIVIKINWV